MKNLCIITGTLLVATKPALVQAYELGSWVPVNAAMQTTGYQGFLSHPFGYVLPQISTPGVLHGAAQDCLQAMMNMAPQFGAGSTAMVVNLWLTVLIGFYTFYLLREHRRLAS